MVKRKICTVQRRTASRPQMVSNAQVGERATNKNARTKGSNNVPSTPNRKTHIWHAKTAEDSANKHDYLLMNRALLEHCKEAETLGDIDMNSDHEAAIAKNEQTTIKISHKSNRVGSLPCTTTTPNPHWFHSEENDSVHHSSKHNFPGRTRLRRLKNTLHTRGA